LRGYIQTASKHIPTSLFEPDRQGATIIYASEELLIKMKDPRYQLPRLPIVVRNGSKDDLLDEETFCERLLQRPIAMTSETSE
jgi:hypothetical protein